MKQPGSRQFLCSFLLVAAGSVGADELPCDRTAPPLPSWQALEYEQHAFMVTARSRLALHADAADPAIWRLQANSSVASNSEDVGLTLAAADGRAQRRERYSQGKDKRYKTYDYLPTMVVRKRFDPPADTSLPPTDWPLSSRKDIPYPPLPDGAVVTDAYALLELAGRFLDSEASDATVAVNTEFNFYLVKLSRGNSPAIKVKYQLSASGQTVSGSRETRAVKLAISPLVEPDKPDFSLLGMHGEITILFDREQTLPLQLRGTAPRLGSAEINLTAVTLREACAARAGPDLAGPRLAGPRLAGPEQVEPSEPGK